MAGASQQGRYAEGGGAMGTAWVASARAAGSRVGQSAARGYQPGSGFEGTSQYGMPALGSASRDHVKATPDAPGWARRSPRGWTRPDDRIHDEVCARLYHDQHVDCADIAVTVHGGVVSLEGSVPQRYMKHTAEDLAAGCAGVLEVENRLRVVLSPG